MRFALATIAVLGSLCICARPSLADDTCHCDKETDPMKRVECIVNCKPPEVSPPPHGGTARVPVDRG
jgi:hypothetical protein